MTKIKELDQDLINKIAAGEVIERPSSVVKELVENSIDANATIITIEVIEGGKSFIKVSDNGCGISPEDISLSIKRHATSKISSTDDLFAIHTLGFRGEALASIAAISNLKLITKTPENETGIKITVENGEIAKQETIPAKTGTTIEISNLFYNVPARKKHLKGIAVEFKHILDIITRYALIHPEIHFTLIHNQKTIINSPATKDFLANIMTVYGRDLTRDLLTVKYENEEVIITGYIGKPSSARADKEYQSLYINKRYIKNYILQKAAYDGYNTLLFHGKHPVFMLNIELQPTRVDVNVHPTKAIVRIEKEYLIYDAIKHAIIDTLVEENLIPEIIENKNKEFDAKLILAPSSQYLEQQTILRQQTAEQSSRSGFQSTQPTLQSSELRFQSTQPGLQSSGSKLQSTESGSEFQSLQTASTEQSQRAQQLFLEKQKHTMNIKLIGKIHNTFIVAEDEKGMILIDQHAAHERVMYEKFLKQYFSKAIAVQQLLSPIVLHLTPQEKMIVEENNSFLNSSGFSIEPFGNDSCLLRTIPSVFGRTQSKELVYNILDELNLGESTAIDELKEERIARAACRAAVKAHDVLEFPEIYKIIEELFQCENRFTCPHGRPAIIHYSMYELEKKFKRKE